MACSMTGCAGLHMKGACLVSATANTGWCDHPKLSASYMITGVRHESNLGLGVRVLQLLE